MADGGSNAFAVIDVETANAAFSSICQIGLVKFQDGIETEAYEWLVDPKSYFDDFNIRLHGIRPDDVKGKPTFNVVYREVAGLVGELPLVSHTHFDRTSINQSCERYRLKKPCFRWVDSAKVVRRTWPDFSDSGYNLATITDWLDIQFRHHNALEDARAAGIVLLRAMEETGFSLPEIIKRAEQALTPRVRDFSREGIGEGPLAGERIVFTGALTLTRTEMADIAAKLGASVDNGVTKKTTIVVVGDQDIEKLAGYAKSSKHRKAEELQAKGRPIRIMQGSDFEAMLG